MAVNPIRRVGSRIAGEAKKRHEGAEGERQGMTKRNRPDGVGALPSRSNTMARVRQFVGGSHQLAITSQSLAELLGLMETECRIALETLVVGGHLRKLIQEPHPPLYCK
ncbi:MAG TPA: hypothetical protein VHS06_02555 [Chloroflexota bacterium]|nr:hypothetical protein [Chloroflexota bacterium]